MNQRAYLGGRPTLLDVAKGAVETFVKVREEILRRITFAKSFGDVFCKAVQENMLHCCIFFIGTPKIPRK